jgi:hypothetical protein
MSEMGTVVGMLLARVTRETEFAQLRTDPAYDDRLETGLTRVRDVVTTKLGADPALARLLAEAATAGRANPRTQQRVRMSIEDAAEDDPSFARILADAVRAARAAGAAADTGAVNNTVSGTVSGSVVQARTIHGNVSF